MLTHFRTFLVKYQPFQILIHCTYIIAIYIVLFNSKQVVAQDKIPDTVIESTTVKMIDIIKKHKATFKTNPVSFYSSIEQLLDPVVAFEQFSRAVMGKYAHRANNEQRETFSYVFKDSLISFYGSAVMSFDIDDVKFELEAPTTDEELSQYQKKTNTLNSC